MLIVFRVENYRSLGPMAELSMVASALKSRDSTLDTNNVIDASGDIRLLRSAAIYGPNASGKSNLVKALDFMRAMVLGSSHRMQAGDLIEVEPYRLRDTEWAPSRFEVVFLLDDRQYRYGFEADSVRVTEEWLYCKATSREKTYFERTGQTIKVGSGFRKEGHGLEERTRDNALFLSVVAQFNGKIAGRVLEWFSDLFVMSGLDDADAWDHTGKQLDDEAERAEIVQWVKRLDLGIDDIQIEDMPPEVLKRGGHGLRVQTLHRIYDAAGRHIGTDYFGLVRHESEGTQKLFALAGPLLSALKHGRVVVIDEFDARLHPLLTRQLVKFFHDLQVNQRGAQLVFTTHDTNLLDASLFRRDQIWFVEKDRFGASHLYSLAEFNVRNDAALERNYIQGKYGAIPFLGDIRRAVGEGDDA